MAFLLAKASQAGSVDTEAASGVENLFVTSFTSGAGGGESEISTGLHFEGKGERYESEPHFDVSYNGIQKGKLSETLGIFMEN